MNIIILFLMVGTNTFISGLQDAPPCFPCRCQLQTADCRGKKLQWVPKTIPDTITELLFHDNAIQLNSKMLSRFRCLKLLDISKNNITFIPNGTFIGLRNLKKLYLDHNPIAYEDFSDSLYRPLQNLLTLRINGTNSTQYNDIAFQPLKALKNLWIDGINNQSFGRGFLKLRNLTKLEISGKRGNCNIREITRKTLANLVYLRKCDIVHCKMLYKIQNGSFSKMNNLAQLNLSHNPCLGMYGLSNATYGISNSSITKLSANEIVQRFPLAVVVPERLTRNLQNTSLKLLSLDDNRIVAFETHALKFLPKTMNALSIKANRLEFSPYVLYLTFLAGLTEVNLSGKENHGDRDIPVTLSDLLGNCPLIRHRCKSNNLNEYDVNDFSRSSHVMSKLQNMLNGNLSIGLPANLTKLIWKKGGINLHIRKLVFGKNSIKYIDLAYNLVTKWIGPVYGLEHLTHLNLSVNRASEIGPTFFDNFPKLLNLDISYNYFGKLFRNDSDGRFFKCLKKLKILNLTEISITRLHKNTFSGLISLEVLIVAHNYLSTLPVDISENIFVIDLSHNEFRWLKRKFMNEIENKTETKKVSLNLGYNSLSCTCEHVHTIRWITQSNVYFGDLSTYICILVNGHVYHIRDKNDITELYAEIEYSCKYFSTLVGVTAVIMLTCALLICSIIYRCRWKLRYVYYAAKYRYRKNNENTKRFTYDAFVSYADEDRDFVLNDIVSKLENDADFMLNIHQRDFTPGRSIAENILEAIQKSRRTLCILSRDFLESYWCRYELQMANMERVTTGRDVLLIVMMEDIPTKDLPAEILYYIQTNSYIEYSPGCDLELFWRNLTVSLQT